jgi:DNA-binding NtrC family response regulator
VDDEPMLLELAAIVLEPAGYRVLSFRDPKEAMHSFIHADPRPNLVITDYAMRLLNGMDVVVQCKALQPGQKVLLISGTVGREVFENAPVKPDRFLAKPYQAEELRDLVKLLIG